MKKRSISYLEIKNFRNHIHTEVKLDPYFNLLTGENGQGKTTLLEAIFFLSHFKTLKGNPDLEMIHYDFPLASLFTQEETTKDTIKIILKKEGRNELLINNHKPKKAIEIFGRLSCISVSSQDLDILYGEPARRRNFLDLFLSQYSFIYLEQHLAYKKYLNQRNALLKQWNEVDIDLTLLETLDEKIAYYGYHITKQRITFLNEIADSIQDIYENLGSQKEKITFDYLSKEKKMFHDPEEYQKMLLEKRVKDKILHTTHFGPHRDDIEIQINSLPARYSSSQGQQRSALLALKFACYQLYIKNLEIFPILLLDDMFSDLDQYHREHLVEFLKSLTSQVIFTCTEPSLAGKSIAAKSKIFTLSKGKIIE